MWNYKNDIYLIAALVLIAIAGSGFVGRTAMVAILFMAVILSFVHSFRISKYRNKMAKDIESGELDMCPSCGYNLAGLKEPTACPECGSKLGSSDVRKRYNFREYNDYG
jgi:hypothetical protein